MFALKNNDPDNFSTIFISKRHSPSAFIPRPPRDLVFVFENLQNLSFISGKKQPNTRSLGGLGMTAWGVVCWKETVFVLFFKNR